MFRMQMPRGVAIVLAVLASMVAGARVDACESKVVTSCCRLAKTCDCCGAESVAGADANGASGHFLAAAKAFAHSQAQSDGMSTCSCVRPSSDLPGTLMQPRHEGRRWSESSGPQLDFWPAHEHAGAARQNHGTGDDGRPVEGFSHQRTVRLRF